MKIKAGVNKNGVQWLKEGDTYYCIFHSMAGELTKSFTNVTNSFIKNVGYNEMRK